MVRSFAITEDHKRWARGAQRKYGRRAQDWVDLIKHQEGRCALSGAPLLFEAVHGTAIAGGLGVHPLYAAVDHVSPGRDHHGHQIVSYDLNDLKGHLPVAIFDELRSCSSWRRLMRAWRAQAIKNPHDRQALRRLPRGRVLANKRLQPTAAGPTMRRRG